MRNILFSLLLAATACAARPPATTLQTTYVCSDAEIVRGGDHLGIRELTASIAPSAITELPRRGWRDGSGDHFVAWPVSPVEREAIEYVVPSDPREDATRLVYDTSSGRARADWRLVGQHACTARGGYSDALAHFSRGESFDRIARELALGDARDARHLVHDALVSLNRRFYRDR